MREKLGEDKNKKYDRQAAAHLLPLEFKEFRLIYCEWVVVTKRDNVSKKQFFMEAVREKLEKAIRDCRGEKSG